MLQLFILLNTTSCFPAYITNYPLNSHITNDNPCPKEYRTIGNQFMFGILPVTRVKINDCEYVEALKKEALWRAGLWSKSNSKLNSKYQLRLDELSASTYDAIFFRILSVSAKVTLRNCFEETILSKRFSKTSYKSVGFTKDLGEMLNKEILATLKELLNK